ncbi:dipeptidase PepE [Salibacter halophilus]|nr:dipeptidase PepE [Salibacter halophilus]
MAKNVMMTNRNLLIVSTSKVHGSGYMEYIQDQVAEHFKNCKKVTFIPFARPGGISHDEYTKIASDAFDKIGVEVRGAHTFESAREAVNWADGLFTGGGNTFVLLTQLYKLGFIEHIQNAVESGKPYMGSSAGSNITGTTISTTNDMPIMYPPTFDALQLVPFNINPHYLDPDPGSKHMGETRETRIKEFHAYNDQPVVGLREGSALIVKGNDIKIFGDHSVRIFEKGKQPYEIESTENLNFLVQ